MEMYLQKKRYANTRYEKALGSLDISLQRQDIYAEGFFFSCLKPQIEGHLRSHLQLTLLSSRLERKPGQKVPLPLNFTYSFTCPQAPT
jgi:hypothetical protein